GSAAGLHFDRYHSPAALYSAKGGLWIATGASLLALLFEPAAAAALTLKLYGAHAVRSGEAPEIESVRTFTCNHS
ncbi:hypothetical protein ACWS7J_27165, partial [Escherichia coli]